MTNFVELKRGWLFQTPVLILICASFVLHCHAGIVVDVPASLHGENRIAPAILKNSAAHFISHNALNTVISQGVADIYKNSSVSPSCARDASRFAAQLGLFFGGQPTGQSETQIETWALQMLDAWGKPPEGILSGHVNALGDFDECLAIRAPSTEDLSSIQFQGKYCLVYAIPNVDVSTKSNPGLDQSVRKGERSVENLVKILNIVGNAELPLIPSIGSCLPSTCSNDEILEILKVVFATIHLTPVTSFCTVDEPVSYGAGAIGTISFLVGLAFFVICGTLLDLLITDGHFTSFKKTTCFAFFHAFSLISNGKKFLNTSVSPNDVSCLHGIRFLSASWVVLGHTYLMGIIQPLWNIVDTYTTITTSLSMVVISNAAIVVDVFFVIGGFLVAVTLLAMLDKSKGKMNIPLLYIHRYLRITPMYIIIICIGTFIFPLLGSGPYWHVARTWAGYCEKNWWKNVLYINNLPTYNTLEDPSDGPCHGMAWYLGVDMQLFFLSPLLLFPIWKWKRLGFLPLLMLTIISAIVPGLLTYLNGYAPTNVPFANRNSKYSQEAYTPTYMRATPYFIGMLTGYFFRTFRKSCFKLPRSTVMGLWLTAFATGFAVLFGPYKFKNPEYDFTNGESAVYVSGHRVAWSVAISWLIFACGTGNGGWINKFLSWKPFVPLGRLTFAIYLVSMHIQFLFHLQYRQPIYFSNYHMVNLYFGHLVMSCIVALVCTLVIEAPFMQLLKLIMPKGEKSSKRADDSNNNQSRCSVTPSPDSGVPSERSSAYGSTVHLVVGQVFVNADKV